MALGETLSAVSKINPSSIFSGSGPDGPGRLGSPAYAIEGLSNQVGISVLIERAFLSTKSKYLPKWLRLSFPLDNEKNKLGDLTRPERGHSYKKQQKLGSITAPSKNNVGKNDNNMESGTAIASLNNISSSEGSWSGAAGNYGGIGPIKSVQSLGKGFVRPTKYKVLFSVPIKVENSEYQKEATFSCSTAALPGISFNTMSSREGSTVTMKKPYEAVYDDIKLTFQVTEDMKERKLFENWMSFIYNPTTNTFSYPRDYYSDIRILQLDNRLNSLKEIKIIDAYPTNISEITLGYDMYDAIETFDVTFTYRIWEPVKQTLFI